MLDDRSYMRSPSFRSHPSATTVLLLLNIGIFVIQFFVEQIHPEVATYLYLSPMGMRRLYLWQLVTFQFLHANVFHLFVNMLGLFFLGRAVEEALGARDFLKLYFGSGLAGGLLQVGLGFLSEARFGSAVLGASAGVFGLVAAFATMFPDRQITLLLFFILPINLRARYLLWGALALASFGVAQTAFARTMIGGGTRVADAAHLGGILFGMAFVYYFVRGHGFRLWWPRLRRAGQPRRELVRATMPKKAFWQRPNKSSELEELTPSEFMSQEVDPILDKISAHGIHSLTEREKKILEVARAKMGKR